MIGFLENKGNYFFEEQSTSVPSEFLFQSLLAHTDSKFVLKQGLSLAYTYEWLGVRLGEREFVLASQKP